MEAREVTLSGGHMGSHQITVDGEFLNVDSDSLTFFIGRLRKSKAFMDSMEKRVTQAQGDADRKVSRMLDKM